MTDLRPLALRQHADRLREIADSLYTQAALIEHEQQSAFLIEVRIINTYGSLSNQTYDFKFERELPGGQVVVVPTTKSWQPPISYATVLRSVPGAERSYIDGLVAIERVVT